MPAGFAGVGAPPRGVHVENGAGIFVEFVADDQLEEFVNRAVLPEARVLPLKFDHKGKRIMFRA